MSQEAAPLPGSISASPQPAPLLDTPADIRRSAGSARWGWGVSAVVAIGGALVLAFVLSFSSPEVGAYERHFVWLFWVNVVVAALLLIIIVAVVLRLALRLRRGKFGSRLLVKLAGIFALVGLLPGLLIYTVSYQFASRSIETWFDVRVAGALDAGLALGKNTLDVLSADLLAKTRVAAQRLADINAATNATNAARGSPGARAGAGSTPGNGMGAGPAAAVASPLTLERLREQAGVADASLVAASGQVLLSAGTSTARATGDRPPIALLRQARQSGAASQIEGLDEETLGSGASATGAEARVRALVRVPRTEISLSGGEDRYLMLMQPLPRTLAVNALQVQDAYSEYQQRALARDSLRRMYIGTLTLALILAVFAAVLLAIVLGNQLARPLLLLADGVRQVAAGDLTAKPVFASGDELGGLTRSFADMTAQVADARSQVQRGMLQLEGARTRLQTILDTLTAGVIVFDREGRIDTINPGATRILQRPVSTWFGRRLSELHELGDFASDVEQRFELLATSPEPGERDQWQESFDLRRSDGSTMTLLARGATLPMDARLLVFDDISDVVSAQRTAAWSEVARRLAHEIKNPLTPIQLSAERLRYRLESKLVDADQALLVRSVATIVNQVQAMQRLVNEFRDYARLPAAQMLMLDLNVLVLEVLGLYGQAQDQGVLQVELASGLPTVLGDATQLRQVVHNLVQNALDAVADQPQAKARVLLSTSAARGEHGELRAVRLMLVDNGPGFAEAVLKRAFEPYVTTKPKGTGLGLAVVKKIADEHAARLSVANLHEGDLPDAAVTGARVSLSFSNFSHTGAPEHMAAAASS